MSISDYTFVDIFDIPDILKVRTKTTVDARLMEGCGLNFPSTPSEVHNDVVELAYAIYPHVDRAVCKDYDTQTYNITSTLFVVPHDCRRLMVPIKEKPLKVGKWKWTGYEYRCTVCGGKIPGGYTEVATGKWKYCPECGASMGVTE